MEGRDWDPDSPILEVKNLHVQFKTQTGIAEVINGVDLRLEAGETAALVGETGCGKSVTSRAILGLFSSNARVPKGEILYKGIDLLDLSDRERQRRRGSEISMIMQDPMTSLNPVFTVGEQMVDVLKYRGYERLGVGEWLRNKFGESDRYRDRVIEMLKKVQIAAPERVFESYPVELSGGMRQRVLIATSLLLEPDILIADEPGTALDVTTEKNILGLLEDLIEDTDASVMYITHDLGVAREVSDFINVMYAGEIIEKAPTDELFSDPQHPYTRGLLDSVPKLSVGLGQGIEGNLPDYTNPPAACRFADRCPHAEPPCRETYPYPRRTAPDHAVACHLHDGPPVEERFGGLESRETVDMGPPPWEPGGNGPSSRRSPSTQETEST